jgi:hypothetical protein
MNVMTGINGRTNGSRKSNVPSGFRVEMKSGIS